MNLRWSIRQRLAFGAASLAGLMVVLFALAVYLHMRAELFEEVDLELHDFAQKISAVNEDSVVPFHYRIRIVTDPANTTASAATAEADVHLLEKASAKTTVKPFTQRAASGAWRLLWATPPDGRRLLAYDLKEIDEVLDELILVCLVGGLVLIGVAAAASWWLSGQVLAPVRSLKEAAEAIDTAALHRRVPLPLVHDELRRLGEVLNAMLTRIEAGFLQSRRFTADASHELRTPLTIMRGELDRLLHESNLDPALEARLLRVQEATARLQRLTENLLLLARLDATSESSPPLGELNFSALVREACEDGAVLAEARGVQLEIDLSDDVIVRGDADGLRRLVLNLLDNATRYNRPSGRVWCHLTAEPKGMRLRIGNTGPGISSSARDRLFQRFMREDPARGSGGHGLGLALAYEIARAHGGELILVKSEDADSTEFILTIG